MSEGIIEGNKQICPICNGSGYDIDYTTACCRRPNEDGSCCNIPIAEPIQIQCEKCQSTGYTSVAQQKQIIQ